VTGLATDYASLAMPGKDPRDQFMLHVSNLLVASTGETAAADVSLQIHTVDGQDLCRVHVQPSSFPVDAVVTVDRKGQLEKKTAFYVRTANATREIAAAGGAPALHRRPLGEGRRSADGRIARHRPGPHPVRESSAHRDVVAAGRGRLGMGSCCSI